MCDSPLILKEKICKLIGKFVQPNSTVLEFGCANGRMTKYMYENLDCNVYILEYEETCQDVV